ncbi:MAG: hypothetical protein BRC29_03415 [Nanohaloarchaea archaeon SW_7_43_1]|nr:MAG: hypothetical protein BRC29_03415 [Nanohaloarchaea archaeon SW_7_43_1]
MDMRDIATNLMFFGAMLSGILFFSASMLGSHDVDVQDENLQDLSEDLNSRTASTEGNLEKNTKNIDSGLEAGLFYLRGVFDVIKTLFQLFLSIPSIGGTIMAELTLPAWVGGLISIPFVYALITLVFEARRSS